MRGNSQEHGGISKKGVSHKCRDPLQGPSKSESVSLLVLQEVASGGLANSSDGNYITQEVSDVIQVNINNLATFLREASQ